MNNFDQDNIIDNTYIGVDSGDALDDDSWTRTNSGDTNDYDNEIEKEFAAFSFQHEDGYDEKIDDAYIKKQNANIIKSIIDAELINDEIQEKIQEIVKSLCETLHNKNQHIIYTQISEIQQNYHKIENYINNIITQLYEIYEESKKNFSQFIIMCKRLIDLHNMILFNYQIYIQIVYHDVHIKDDVNCYLKNPNIDNVINFIDEINDIINYDDAYMQNINIFIKNIGIAIKEMNNVYSTYKYARLKLFHNENEVAKILDAAHNLNNCLNKISEFTQKCQHNKFKKNMECIHINLEFKKNKIIEKINSSLQKYYHNINDN